MINNYVEARTKQTVILTKKKVIIKVVIYVAEPENKLSKVIHCTGENENVST